MAQQRNIPAEQHARWQESQRRKVAREHEQNPPAAPTLWLDPRRDDVRVQLAADQLSRRTGLLPSQAMAYVIPIVQALSDHGHLNGPDLTSPEEWPAA